MTTTSEIKVNQSVNNNNNNNNADNNVGTSQLISLENESPSNSTSSYKLKKYYHGKNVLFYAQSMRSVAEAIRAASNGSVILGEIDWNSFPDGFPNIFIHKSWHIRWQNVTFLADLSNPKNIFEQYSLMCVLPRMLAKSVKIFVAYFPTGTMERVTDYGSIATAATLARMLSSIPNCAQGCSQLCICDIHALPNQFYFTDNILVRLETCIPLLLQKIKEMKLQNKQISIAFPDEGAQKRFNKFFANTPQIICTKRRGENNVREIYLKEGNVVGRDIVIVDDLVQTGGTLAQCALLLRTEKASSISCYCTHAVFPNNSWQRFCSGGKNEGLFETFWVTDTIPETCKLLCNSKPYEVLSTASIFLPIINDDDGIGDVENLGGK